MSCVASTVGSTSSISSWSVLETAMLSLPIGPLLSNAHQARVIEALRRACG